MNAIAYIRVSSREQVESGLSITHQKSKVEAYCQALDINLIDVICDAGYSAKTLNRPGMIEVISQIKAKIVDAIIILKLDRLTRSVKDLGSLTELFDKTGVALISVHDSINTSSAAGKLVLNVLGSVAQWEREAIGERTKAAMQVKKSTGQLVGSVPYGYDLAADGTTLKANSAEQANLLLIKELRERGLSYSKIAQELELKGIATKKGGRWAAQTICNLFKKLAT